MIAGDQKNKTRTGAMTQDRISHADLDWWLERAGRLDWIFAKTYAATAPHSYVVEGRTRGMSKVDYVRAGRVIHTFGRPAKFYGMTSIYLTSPDGLLKWWAMDADVRDTNLINQATTDRLYGVQNAPVTESGVETPHDAVASSYDQYNPTPAKLAARLREAVAALAREYPPAVLDVGCGTGRVLDLELTLPDRYAGVDPSTSMLNQLVRKHPNVAGVYPMLMEQALGRQLFTPGQFEIVIILLDRADELPAETIQAVEALASRGTIFAVGDDVKVLSTIGPHG
jgi:hypothetical protein